MAGGRVSSVGWGGVGMEGVAFGYGRGSSEFGWGGTGWVG